MKPSFGKAPETISQWERQHLPDYAPLSAALPLEEAELVQTGPGHFDYSSRVVDAGSVAAAHTISRVPSVVSIVEAPTQLMFFIVQNWSGELKANGQIVQPCQIHLADPDRVIYIAGQERDMLGVLVERDLFVRTLAALQGIPDAGLTRLGRTLDLSQTSFARMQKALMGALYQRPCKSPGEAWDAGHFSERVFGTILEAYLSADSRQYATSGFHRNSAQIVRAVEELFERAGSAPLSLADLCAAAGVSKSTLYRAFDSHCGVPPLYYIHQRRLTRAHSRLVATQPERGAIKRTALELGFTELGRFSVEYRQLFGESPKYTLQNVFV